MDKNVYSSEVKWGVVTDELSDDLKMNVFCNRFVQ